MKHIYFALLILSITFKTASAQSIDSLSIDLFDAIEMAQRQSLNAFLAKNTYLEGYWSYRSYKAEQLPYVQLNTFSGNYSSGNTWISKDQEF